MKIQLLYITAILSVLFNCNSKSTLVVDIEGNAYKSESIEIYKDKTLEEDLTNPNSNGFSNRPPAYRNNGEYNFYLIFTLLKLS